MDLSVECLEKRRRFVYTENVEKQKKNIIEKSLASAVLLLLLRIQTLVVYNSRDCCCHVGIYTQHSRPGCYVHT
jgi:hypothetical protein